MSDLHDYLDETLAPADRWQVTDLASADWAARKVQQARAKQAELQAERDRVVAAADEWLARESKTLEDDASFFADRLAEWLASEIDQDPKGKASRALPCGAVVKRTPARESLVVDDELALVEWLRSQSDSRDLVEFVPKYSKAAVKKLVTGDGLAVPGVRIEPGTHGWKVDV